MSTIQRRFQQQCSRSQDTAAPAIFSSLKLFHILLAITVLLQSQMAQGFSPDSSQEATSPPSTSTPFPTILQSGSGTSFTCGDLKIKTQRKYCTNTTNFKHVIVTAEKYAKEECEFQFRTHKWRCHGFSMLSSSNITKKAYKETSFVYSLISSMLTFAIAEACENNIMTCPSINEGVVLTGNDEFNHTVTTGSHVLFAMRLAESFLNSKENSRNGLTDRHRINRHNNNIGWQVVYDQTRTECRCFSVSTGCTVTSCQKKLPTRREVSSLLHEKFQEAIRVKPDRNGETFLPYTSSSNGTSDINYSDMIYLDSSPNFCFRDLSLGSPGVKGQQCDPHGQYPSHEIASCDDNCCGRGHVEEEVEVADKCCGFVWCCRVECHDCVSFEKVHRCK